MKSVKKVAKKGFCLLMAMIIMSLCIVPAFADNATGKQEKTIRIGCIDYNGFIAQNDDGTYSGYGVEMLNDISSYTGWKYEFVFESFTNILEGLKDGSLDFFCHAQKTYEREEEYIFSKYATGSESSILYARQNDERFYYDDYSAFEGITVAMMTDSYQNVEFSEYARIHNFSYNAQYYATKTECFEALDNNTVDAVAMGSLGGIEGYKVLGVFASDPFYFMSGKGNEETLDELDYALGQIFASNPIYDTQLYNKYYYKSISSGLFFTREETEYINKHNTITVGLMQDRSPLSYMNSEGNPDGMIYDVMQLIAQKSGLVFDYKFLDMGQTGMSFLQNSQGDLVAGVASSAFSAPNPALLQSKSILDSSVVFVGRSGLNFSTSSTLTLALPTGFINGQSIVSASYPNFSYYNGKSNDDCLAAIRDGKSDVMLQNLYIIRECLQSPRYEGLEIYPAYSFDEYERVVALPQNALLVSIINKTIDCITEGEANDIVIANTVAKTYQPDFGEIMYKYRFPFTGIIILFIIVIAMFILLTIIKHHNYVATEKMNKKLEVSNNQLADAVTQADNANKAKSQFLSRMSHEIRTPMNAIIGLTTIAKQYEKQPEKVTDCLDKIETSSKVLLNIVNDVLDMSSIESNKLKISNEEFDIKQILTELITVYYPQCHEKGVDFNVKTSIEHEILIGDSLRVNQILLNLVSNAFKFTPKGGSITISASETSRKDNTTFIRFAVADTGCGMTPDMLARLFRPFEQETSNTAKEHGGSGLGTSIAKNLVELMHGAINVESEKGKGTVFTVDLPFEIADVQENEFSKNSLNGTHILIVDDDTDSLKYESIVFKRLGAKFDLASSGAQALEMIGKANADNNPYSVCIIDWKMPDMNGVEVTRKIRENETNKPLIIIASAYDLNEVGDEAVEAGADHFVTKPLFQSTIFNVLTNLTHGKITNMTVKENKYDFTGHRVLLAEDQELNAEIAEELLGFVNMAVDHAENGLRAVEMFSSAEPGTYTAILMDVQMPEMDGYEAANAIRSLERPDAKTIPIFAMTANAFNEDVARSLSAGMNGHIAKPIDTEILYSKLQSAVNGTV